MRVAVITCEAYRDAREPFKALFEKFWPDCPYWCDFYSDDEMPGETWCSVVARCAREAGNDPVMLLMEDFFLTSKVQDELITHGLNLLKANDAGCVRLYPSPGANEEFGDPYFGLVKPGTPYRISCQASIFDPAYLYAIASQCHDHGEASDFEHGGTTIAESLPAPVLAFKRDVQPWPLEYISSAISRGVWNPQALRWCKDNGIAVDSKRKVARR